MLAVPSLVTIDFLERQTFTISEAKSLVDQLGALLPTAIVHAWPVIPEAADAVAEDAYWDASEGELYRTPEPGWSPTDYPSDVCWRDFPEPDQASERWVGGLYVDPDNREVTLYGLADLADDVAWGLRRSSSGALR